MPTRSLLWTSLLFAGCTTTQAPLTATVVTPFQAMLGQLPEGLALRDGVAYVGFAPGAAVVAVDPAGHITPYATVPSTSGGSKGYTLGLIFDPAGQLYVAQASFDPSVVPGVYRVPARGGAVTMPWAADPAMTFPNGFAFAADGSLFVADSTGAIFKIDQAGHVSTWARDPLLLGDPAACPGLLPTSIGANGIVITDTDAWVTNTDHGTLVRIPIGAGGAAGTPRAVVQDCALAGADGLAQDTDGSFVVAINGQNKIVRIAQDGSWRTLVTGAPLDFPASISLEDQTIFATAAALVSASAGDPTPALIEIH